MKRSMQRLRRKTRSTRKPTTIPTEKDWGDYSLDLDAKDSYDYFAGYTNEEMQPRLRQNPCARTSDLRSMPEVPFQYYILGFRDFVMARNFERLTASESASCFLELILKKLENHPRHIVPIMPELLSAIEYVAQH